MDRKEMSLEDKAKELQEENERLKEQLIDAKGIRHLVKDPYNESFYPTFDENSEAYKEAWIMYKGMKCAGMLHCEWDMCTVDFFIYFFMAGRKQALKDMMEKAEIFCNQTIIKHPDIKPFRSGQECTADHLRLHLKNFTEDL